MFNPRGGFPGQRPMGLPQMNQPGLNNLRMNMPGMPMSGMNMSGMGMPNMNQSNMNLSGMNQSALNTGMPRMGLPGMNLNVGLPNVNQPGMNPPGMNVFRMGPPGMNQGGMGFQSEIKSQGFNMRPMDSPGSFLGGNSEQMGMKSLPLPTPERHMGSPALPQHFSSPSGPMAQAPPRMLLQNQEMPSLVNRVMTHSSDQLRGNPKTSLQEPPHLMEKKSLKPLSMFGNLNPDMGIKPGPSSSLDPMSSAQNRYTNESASSILKSFGLSNEDLEELSRYPDEQLTPVNLPNILRDIRLRKINRTGGTHNQGGGGRRPGGEALPSKVIDYGHSSKYQIDNSTSSRPFDSSRTEQKPSPVSKQPAPSSTNTSQKDNSMDNKIPTISSSRKPFWQPSKHSRFNNKVLVGEEKTAETSDSSVTISNIEVPVISIKPDSTPLADIPVISDTAATTSPVVMTAESPVGTAVSQVSYPPSAEANPPTGKGSWLEQQKTKRIPTPSMMNDYFAASPRIFPHICSLCNLECYHVKDWIKHQNNASHIDSCRKLRQQYPDWNPELPSSNRNEGKKETIPKKSRSKSGSPRRAGRSGSRHRARRSRSRSPRSGKRSRSRSPRRARPSPRLRSPHKSAKSPRHSPSPRKQRKGRSSTPPDKTAVDAAVQDFIEASKLKSGEKAKPAKSSSDTNKLPPKSSNTNVKDVKGKQPVSGSTPAKTPDTTAKKSNSSSNYSNSSKKPNGNNSEKSSSNAPRKPLTSNTSKKPVPSSSAPKKPVVSTGAKKSTPNTGFNKKPQPSRAPNAGKGPPKQPAPEPYKPLNKFTSKSGSDRIVHVANLPDSGYTDQDILKIVQPFGKVCDILIVRSKNEAFLETNFKEAAAAAVKFSETVPVMINGKRVVLSLARQQKKQEKTETKGTSNAESGKSSLQKAPPPKGVKEEKDRKDEKTRRERKKPAGSNHNIVVPPGFVKCHRLADPPLQDADKCVVVISNLPEKQYTVEEVSNLAKPFGGVNDVLVVSSHRKAYLELPSRTSVDSMIKFYNVFPTCLSGSILTIAMSSRFKNLKDENLIFADLLEQASFKITPTIYEKFVHLSDLPEGEVEEFQLTRIGLRFGKVEHYVVFRNKRKAILHMSSAGTARGMHTFLSRFPGQIGQSVIKCTLCSKTTLAEDEYITYLEEKKSSEPDPIIHEEVAPNPEEVNQLEDAQPLSSDISETEMKATNVEVEDDDDYEEAAEAPEAPEAPSFFTQPEAEVEQPCYSVVSQPYVTEESDVFVSVESDEEECVAQCPAIPITDSVSMEQLLTAEDSESDGNDMETSNEISGGCPKPVNNISFADDQSSTVLEPKHEDLPDEATAAELTNKESEGSSVAIGHSGKEESSPTRAEESSDKETKSESGRSPREGKSKRSEETVHSSDEKSRQRKERSRQSSHGDASEGSKDTEQAMAASGPSLTRTAKYNPQRGELSVTLTVDSQKSSSRTPDSRKRPPGDRGFSGRESSTPKSSSNRSSPSESTCSNPKSSTGSYQTKSSHRGVGTQDRDSKTTSRSRENDSRSNRKDDRSKDSNSSRHIRTSTRSTRGQKSEKEGDDSFPFNLDEFVTVDEIVEENSDLKNQDEGKEEQSDNIGATKRGEKTKGNRRPASDTKKPKNGSGDVQELSFVTLDEVGDEDENTPTQENVHDDASSLMTDKVHIKDGLHSTQDSSMLMTLDEVSDDEEANASAMLSGSSAMPDKDQLFTLDEISGEDEEQTSHSELSNPDKLKTKCKDVASVKPETPVVLPEEPNQELDQGSRVKQPLLTLDEVKADNEEDRDSLADIEHKFLTVDEIGEEEEDMEVKEENVAESQPKTASKTRATKSKTSPKLSQPAPKTPPARRGRPRKRPLPETTDDKDTSQLTSADSSVGELEKISTKCDGQAKAGDSTITTPDKPKSGTPKTSETPAKKTKLASPSPGKAELGTFNSSVAVGLEFLVAKTGYFCELCSLFYMDDASKIKHCKSLRHYQAVQKHLNKEKDTAEESSPGM